MFRFDRFNELLKVQGKSKAHIGRLLGKTQFYMRDKQKNQSDFKPYQVAIIAEDLHTTPEYLMGETDDPSIPSETDVFAAYLDDLRQRPETRTLLEATRGMTREQVEKMAEFAMMLRGGNE